MLEHRGVLPEQLFVGQHQQQRPLALHFLGLALELTQLKGLKRMMVVLLQVYKLGPLDDLRVFIAVNRVLVFFLEEAPLALLWVVQIVLEPTEDPLFELFDVSIFHLRQEDALNKVVRQEDVDVEVNHSDQEAVANQELIRVLQFVSVPKGPEHDQAVRQAVVTPALAEEANQEVTQAYDDRNSRDRGLHDLVCHIHHRSWQTVERFVVLNVIGQTQPEEERSEAQKVVHCPLEYLELRLEFKKSIEEMQAVCGDNHEGPGVHQLNLLAPRQLVPAVDLVLLVVRRHQLVSLVLIILRILRYVLQLSLICHFEFQILQEQLLDDRLSLLQPISLFVLFFLFLNLAVLVPHELALECVGESKQLILALFDFLLAVAALARDLSQFET